MSEDFTSFEIEDFAFHTSFQDWVLLPTSEHRHFWEHFLVTHPHQTDKILAARELVAQLKSAQQVPPNEEFAQVIWGNVQRRIHPGTKTQPLPPLIWRVAASVSLVVGLGMAIWWSQNGKFDNLPLLPVEKNAPAEILEKVNRTDKVLKVHLSDGSVVSLGKESRLTYPKTFDSAQRVVSLSGEAFFEIEKNSDWPFLVFANETVTKVLGTSFRIKAYDNAPEVSVKVKTGRVSVFVRKDFEQKSANAERRGVVLTPNQKAIFIKNQIQLTKTLVNTPEILLPPSQQPSFDFNDTPLSKVFSSLELAYGIEIVADPGLTSNRALTVSMEDETLYEKLDVICMTLGLSYQIVDAKVIIESNRAITKQ